MQWTGPATLGFLRYVPTQTGYSTEFASPFAPILSDVESGRRMEFLLNLAWTLLAFASFCLWMRHEGRKGADRRLAIIALGLLLVILFPVISVSDDLWSIQNPAEADSGVRRDQIAPIQHSILPSLVALPASLASTMETPSRRFRKIPKIRLSPCATPALHPIENRPPPVA